MILSATAATGTVMTVAAAEETTAVADLSLSVTNNMQSTKCGLSLVVDFNTGAIELYPHVGFSEGSSSGFTYSVGFVENYNGLGDYGGAFLQSGVGYYWGINHCFDPYSSYDEAVKATTITFGSGASWGVGYDWYFDSIVIKKPRE